MDLTMSSLAPMSTKSLSAAVGTPNPVPLSSSWDRKMACQKPHAGSYLAEAAGIQFGYSVAGAGDVNQDGYDDILVGAPSLRTAAKGKVFLFLG